MIAQTAFKNEKEKKEYVLQCEKRFENDLDILSNSVCGLDDVSFITLSGPTCSGKTTASEKLISEFNMRGKTVKTVSLDNFFRNADELKKECEGGVLDFDSEKALDIPALKRFMEDIQATGCAKMPIFDFGLARRNGFEEISVKDVDIVLFEGIQAAYPVFTELFYAGTKVKKIYISVLDNLVVNGKTIPPREIRLWRRLVRDFKFRNASPEYSYRIWEGVVRNEDKNILPFVNQNEIIIESLHGYEPCMLKKELCALMNTVSKDSKYYEKSLQILQTLDGIDEISSDYLPKNSLYREFL